MKKILLALLLALLPTYSAFAAMRTHSLPEWMVWIGKGAAGGPWYFYDVDTEAERPSAAGGKSGDLAWARDTKKLYVNDTGTWALVYPSGSTTGVQIKEPDPASPAAGDVWINDRLFKYHDSQVTSATQTIEIQSNKNVASGYAGLDGTGILSQTVIPTDHRHGTSAGAPSAGACNRDGHLIVDTTNEAVYFCSDGAGGNARSFGTLGDAYNQATGDSGSVIAAGSETLRFEGTGGITTTATAGTPDKVTITAAHVRSISTQTFTASGTYTKPAGVLYAQVIVVGGGGGGGGAAAQSASNASGGGGGGGGGYAESWLMTSSIGATETITIGAAGSGGAAGNNVGTAGGDSCFGGTSGCGGTPITRGNGGAGGAGAPDGIGSPDGGTGGTTGGSNVTIARDGQAGGDGMGSNTLTKISVSGAGGAAGGGQGVGGSQRAATNSESIAGRAGALAGGGGSGAAVGELGAAAAGGNGGAGRIIVIEYKSSAS